MLFEAQAPANLALIKYMGKTSDTHNTPTHASLSWTLKHLISFVELEVNNTSQSDVWQPLQRHLKKKQKALQNLESSLYQQRFLDHLTYLKSQFGLKSSFIIRSCNNFPSDAGLASSASSFAALTKAFAKALKELKGMSLSDLQCAHLSRRGSGSSCRSFFSGCLWKANGELSIIQFPKNWIHTAVLVCHEKKHISSSEAHRLVLTSPLYKNRPQRAEKRIKDVITQLKQNHWAGLFQTLKEEFWDMMDLFHTSSPRFSYLKPGSLKVLQKVDILWKKHRDGPLVTMDAGPHVHLIWRQDQRALMSEIKACSFPFLSSLSNVST